MTKSTICDRCRYLAHEYYEDIQPASSCCNNSARNSGCGCAASVLAAYILPRVVSGFWKRVLFVPTGAMLSKVSFNEGESVAGIAHGVVIEHISKETEV